MFITSEVQERFRNLHYLKYLIYNINTIFNLKEKVY
jgi:hypothetical protein